jgi:hypothetical protein
MKAPDMYLSYPGFMLNVIGSSKLVMYTLLAEISINVRINLVNTFWFCTDTEGHVKMEALYKVS